MSIRLRLTLAFSVAMVVLFSSGALVLYRQLGAALDRTVNDGLRSNLTTIAALVAQADSGLRDARLIGPGKGFAQVIDAQGRVFDQTAGLERRALISPYQLVTARRAGAPALLVNSSLRGEKVRLMATSVTAQDQSLVIIAGVSLASQQNALGALRRKLLLGGPIGLLIASLGGYALASAALRPVERMRRTAATISGHTHNQRLPIGRAQDEISRLAHTLNEMLDRVDQAIEREHRFVTDASHELRTPLALLKTELEIALRHANNASELRAALSSASDEADRLNQLAESLLLLARADNGKLPLTASTIDPASLLRTVALRYERRADECNRRITTSSAIDHPISADGQLLEHALGNLVENALHHGSGTVALRALESTDALEVHCRDQGRGFDPAIAATAFERFARADDARAKAGSGLGLAIVAAIAATHGGSAHLENGAHTDVWIRLPLHPPQPPDTQGSRTRDQASIGGDRQP